MRFAACVGLAATLFSMPLTADDATTLYSKTFYGKGECDGHDNVLFMAEPWEKSPITILGVSISHLTVPAVQTAYAFAGSSNPEDGDVLARVDGMGGATNWYPPGTGFAFPGTGQHNPPHLDAHAWCLGAPPVMPVRAFLHRLRGFFQRFHAPLPPSDFQVDEVSVTIFYTKPSPERTAATAPLAP